MRDSLRARGSGPENYSKTVTNTLGASLAVACLATGAVAQSDDVIVLPTVDVETTEATTPEVKPRKTAARPRVTTPAAPQECTAAFAGTPICAEEEAAERAAQEAAALAAEQARAAKAAAGGSSYADPDSPYKANTSANRRLQGPLKDTPRTVTAITQEVLETTGTTSVREIARTTPGISIGFGEGGSAYGDNIYIRGFRANNDIYTDGIRDSGIGIGETFNTEQVEVTKGPAGTVGGRGTTGGALDVVSKKPQDVDFSRYVTTVTDAGTVRQTIDINRNLDDRTQIRFNGMIQEGEVAGRESLTDDRRGAALALRYKATDALTLDLGVSHTKIEQTPDWGVPYVNNEDLGVVGPVTEYGVDPSTFYGINGRDYQNATQDALTFKQTYEFDNGLTLTNTLRASSSLNDYILTAPSRLSDNDSTDPADWTVGLSSKSLYQETDVLTDVLELSGQRDIAGRTHKFVVGALYSDEGVSNRSWGNLTSEDYQPPEGQRGCTVTAIDPDPIGEGCWGGEPATLGDNLTYTDIKTTSLYILDTVDLNEKWTVNGGLRLDMYDIERNTVRDGDTTTLSRSDTMLNWNLGATYRYSDRLNFYGAAATSTNPMGSEIAAGGSFYGGLDTGGENLAPEENTSLEIGAKYELNPNLLLTAALFQTTKDNAREDVGPRGASVTSDTLKYRIRGVELGVAGKVTERLSVFGGATMMDSKVLDSVDADAIGNSIPNVAHHQFNLLATYQMTDEWMLGGRVNFIGERDLGSTYANGRTLPSAVTLDLLSEYEIADNTVVKLGITNLTDKVVYDAGYRSGTPFTYVAPGREVSLSLDMKF